MEDRGCSEEPGLVREVLCGSLRPVADVGEGLGVFIGGREDHLGLTAKLAARCDLLPRSQSLRKGLISTLSSRPLGKLLHAYAPLSYGDARTIRAPCPRGNAVAPRKESDRIPHSVSTERAVKGAAGVTARTKCVTTSAALGAALPCWKVAKRLPSPQADFLRSSAMAADL